MSLDWQEQRLASFSLPEDHHGKRVLDIGPWDGYFTFEMERRGAEVTAIDYIDQDTFRELHRVLGSRAVYRLMDVYELDPGDVGMFDIVLCLGVLYHLKHPLLALERICAVTRDVCIVDTFVVDDEAWATGVRPPVPYIEFYERDELAGQIDNWSGPTVSAVEALVRSAGFAQAEILGVGSDWARVAAHRRWRSLPPDEEPQVRLLSLHCHSHRGRCFQSGKEEYITLWSEWKSMDASPLEMVFPEVDGFGIAPISAVAADSALIVGVRVPPGISPGRHEARLKIGRAAWSNAVEFYVDLPPVSNPVELNAVQDAVTWQTGQVDWGQGGWLTLWVAGLSPQADPGNTVVEIAGLPHFPEAVMPDRGQINVRLRPSIQAGEQAVKVIHRGAAGAARTVRVIGQPPKLRGLEALSK